MFSGGGAPENRSDGDNSSASSRKCQCNVKKNQNSKKYKSDYVFDVPNFFPYLWQNNSFTFQPDLINIVHCVVVITSGVGNLFRSLHENGAHANRVSILTVTTKL